MKAFLGLFSFFFLSLNKLLFLISLKSIMVLSYSFMVYVCEDMPIRDLGVKHENLGIYPKGNNG